MDQSLDESTPNRRIAKVVTIRKISEPEPLTRYTPQEAIAEVEELRRMFVTRFGDPDAPIAKVVIKRRHEQ